MEIRIGVVFHPGEIVVDTDDTADEVQAKVDDVMANDDRVLLLTDKQGNRVGVPGERIAFVHLESSSSGKTVGFAR
jgi:hypothetical protein